MATTNLYNNLHTDSVIDLHYSDQTLYQHAIKLFLMSYPEFDPNRVEENRLLINDMFRQYRESISELYGNLVPNSWQFLTLAYQQIRPYFLLAAVKGFRGRKNCQSLSFRFIDPTLNKESRVVTLEQTTEVQASKIVWLTYEYAQFQEARRQKHPLVIRVEGVGWAPKWIDRTLEQFEFGADRLHPEGFQSWVYFGRGISLHIEIIYRAALEVADRRKDIFDFQLHSLHRMILTRLDQTGGANWHQYLSRTNRVTCKRVLANPSSLNMYWRTPDQLRLKKIRNYSEGRRPKLKPPVTSAVQTVNYLEVHRSMSYSEDTEETVCLCSEWCNWPAFFHYNPLYRFIIIMNTQLFLPHRFACPELYALAAQLVLTRHNAIRKCGYVLPLFYSADQYRVLFKEQHLDQNAGMCNMYNTTEPNPYLINALNYKKLRDTNALPIGRLCRDFNDNPLADVCVKNLMQYFVVLERLHNWVLNHGQPARMFIWPHMYKEWGKELLDFMRQPIVDYLKFSYVRLFQIQNPLPDQNMDKVFGTDAEYLELIPKSEGAAQVKYRRLRALGSVDNRFNVSVYLDTFLNTYLSVYKFFARIETMLPKPEQLATFRDITTYCTTFDTDFQMQFNTRQQTVRFNLSVDDLNKRQVTKRHRKSIAVFYTLKLYSFAFVIQKHCLEARGLELEEDSSQPDQIAELFTFIVRNDVVEQGLKNYLQLNRGKPFHLFRVNNVMVNRFHDFYDNFWEQPDHEYVVSMDLIQCAESAREQYRKLVVFSHHHIIKKPRFTTILLALRKQLYTILKRAKHRGYIFAPMIWLEKRYEDAVDVMDVLSLYLVRAVCFTFTRVICQLFRALKENQLTALVQANFSFSLGKPGWTELLKSRAILSPVLDRLLTEFIVYDDEMERIATTIDDFTRVVKRFYGQYYKKLSKEWLSELTYIYQYTRASTIPHHPTPPLQPNQVECLAELMLLQLSAGIAFSAAFYKQYRITWFSRRKVIYRVIDAFNRVRNAGQHLARTADCRPLIDQYLSDGASIRKAQPFLCRIWWDRIRATYPVVAGLTLAQVNLDPIHKNAYSFVNP